MRNFLKYFCIRDLQLPLKASADLAALYSWSRFSVSTEISGPWSPGASLLALNLPLLVHLCYFAPNKRVSQCLELSGCHPASTLRHQRLWALTVVCFSAVWQRLWKLQLNMLQCSKWALQHVVCKTALCTLQHKDLKSEPGAQRCY